MINTYALLEIPGSISIPEHRLADWALGEYKRLEGENAALREQLAALTSRIQMTLPAEGEKP